MSNKTYEEVGELFKNLAEEFEEYPPKIDINYWKEESLLIIKKEKERAKEAQSLKMNNYNFKNTFFC